MTSIIENFGIRLTEFDLSKPITDAEFAQILKLMGQHKVLSFANQHITSENLKEFSMRFGSLQVDPSRRFVDPDCPEVGILSNVIVDGQPIGLSDAGQDWHTDMSYNELIGFTNVLYAVQVPYRDGKPLGSTGFADMERACADLPADIKKTLVGRTATHDFNKFWEEMRQRPGSTRPPLTPEQRAKRPPSVHPILFTHPITGREVLYANPGYVVQINGLPPSESDALMDYLFEHQLQAKYQYYHQWSVNDVLMWDHIGTLHNAIPDYAPTEHRLIKRCQVMADRILQPGFYRDALARGVAA